MGILINMFLFNRRPPAPPLPSVQPDLERGGVRGHRSSSLRRRRLQVEGALQTFKFFVFIFDCLKIIIHLFSLIFSSLEKIFLRSASFVLAYLISNYNLTLNEVTLVIVKISVFQILFNHE